MTENWQRIIVILGALLLVTILVIVKLLIALRKRRHQLDQRDRMIDEKDQQIDELKDRVIKTSLDNAEMVGLRKAHDTQTELMSQELEKARSEIIKLNRGLAEAEKYAEWAGNMGLNTNNECNQLRHENTELKIRLSKYEEVEV